MADGSQLLNQGVVNQDRGLVPQQHRLGAVPRGYRGRVVAIEVEEAAAERSTGLSAEEMENRLIEFGFVEGAIVEVLHEGPIRRDPIAVRVNHTTVALRRREAMSIVVSDTEPD